MAIYHPVMDKTIQRQQFRFQVGNQIRLDTRLYRVLELLADDGEPRRYYYRLASGIGAESLVRATIVNTEALLKGGGIRSVEGRPGICREGGRWSVRIRRTIDHKRLHIDKGMYDSRDEAIAAYDAAMRGMDREVKGMRE